MQVLFQNKVQEIHVCDCSDSESLFLIFKITDSLLGLVLMSAWHFLKGQRCLTRLRQTVFWNKTLSSELAGLNYTVYYWGKPIVKSTYVGFALFLYLELFCLCDSFLFFCPDFYLVPFLSFFWNVIFERTKIWRNLCLSLSIANFADYFSLRFVFSVRLQML